MCIHPEALSYFFKEQYVNSVVKKGCNYTREHDLPNKAYWVIRNSSYHRPETLENIGEAESETFK